MTPSTSPARPGHRAGRSPASSAHSGGSRAGSSSGQTAQCVPTAGSSLPSSTPFKWRALDVLSRSAVGLTAAQVAGKLMPPAVPFRSAHEWRARQALRASLRKRASKAIRRLAVDGLVQPAGRPRLDPLELAHFRAHGWGRFRHFEPVVRRGWIVGEVVTDDPAEGRFRHRIVEALAEAPEGVPYPMLLELTGGATRSGRESGTWRRAFADLVDSGTVIPGRARLPTLKGLQALRRRACKST